MASPTPHYCAQQTRRHDPDRYYCGLFVPSGRRDAYYAVTAFYQEIARIPEMISEPVLGEIRLQWWRDAVEGMFSGHPSAHEIMCGLGEVKGRFGLARAPLEDLLEARMFDLAPSPPKDSDVLLDYADGTAGALNELLLAVLVGEGNGSAELAEAASHAARAIALAGLMRTLPFHASARRLYLPQELMARERLKAEDVFAMRPSPELCAVVRELCGLSGEYLEKARGFRRHVPREALPVFFPLAIAHKVLLRLRKCSFDPFHPRMILHRPGRLIIPFNRLFGRY
ncbi:MAG: squalene/phytoene synthase family protein [Alphaproteobacteria bacterium]|nr:squalene/phytoene synthase family protein [Alphaproteobacteria bacterium]